MRILFEVKAGYGVSALIDLDRVVAVCKYPDSGGGPASYTVCIDGMTAALGVPEREAFRLLEAWRQRKGEN